MTATAALERVRVTPIHPAVPAHRIRFTPARPPVVIDGDEIVPPTGADITCAACDVPWPCPDTPITVTLPARQAVAVARALASAVDTYTTLARRHAVHVMVAETYGTGDAHAVRIAAHRQHRDAANAARADAQAALDAIAAAYPIRPEDRP